MLTGLLIGGLFDAIVRYLMPVSILGALVLTWFGLSLGVNWRWIRWAGASLATPWVAIFLLSAAIGMNAVDVIAHSDTFDRPEPVISAVAVVAFVVIVAGRWLLLKLGNRRT